MMLNTFFNNFELLADVQNGMQKLRELILQLAIQGKLGTQNPKDESAAVLLEKIRAKTDNLIKEKKIKKIKSLPPIEANEIPYEKPEHWAWCRLLGIIQISSGNFLPSHKMAENGHIPVFGGNGITGYHDQYNVTKPTIVIGRVGFYCGSVHITPELAWITDNAFLTYFSESHIYLKFLYWLLKGTDLSIRDNSTAQPVISGRKIYPIIVGLPPYKEQKRIVTKVNQLMALCDQLEANQQKKHEQRIRLNNAALDKLLTAPTPEEFAQHWQRICDNFDLLYDAPETVGQLRQAILQLAVQGKLVAQDEGDDPAAVLLEKIKVSKEGQKQSWNRKSQLLSPIDPEEISFSPPKNWEWKRLGEITEIVGGVTKGRKLLGRQTAYYPYLRVANVQRGFLNLDKIKEIEIPKEELEKYRLHRGDVLLTEGGDWDKLGRSAIWDGQIQDCIHQNHIFRARPWNIGLRSQWIVLFTNSSVGRQYFENASKKTTNLASINMTQLRNCPFPIPPVAEQDRILKKVNELMALCDELEAGLVQAQTDGGKLMEAVVHHVLAG